MFVKNAKSEENKSIRNNDFIEKNILYIVCSNENVIYILHTKEREEFYNGKTNRL